jgi:hypothetical protein
MAAAATVRAANEVLSLQATTVNATGQIVSAKQCCQCQVLSAASIRVAVGVAATVPATHANRARTQPSLARTHLAVQDWVIGITCASAPQGTAHTDAETSWSDVRSTCVWTATCPQKMDSEMDAPANVISVGHP